MKRKFDYEKAFMGVGYEHVSNAPKVYAMDYRVARLKECVAPFKGSLLDLGCGGGTNTEKLAKIYKRARVYGCDISQTAIAYAKKYGGGKVKYAVIKGKIFPYKSNTFDVVVCLDVLEHVPNVEAFLTQIRRVLKKNGKLYLVIPCEGQAFTYTKALQIFGLDRYFTRKYWGHIHPEFTHKNVISLVKNAKFSIKRISYSEHWLYQASNILFYFSPKILLSLLFGNDSSKYSDQGVVMSYNKKNAPKGILMSIRALWFWLSDVFGLLRDKELRMGKNISFGAWKVHILAEKR